MQSFMWTQQHDEPAAEVLKLQKPKHALRHLKEAKGSSVL